LATVGELLNQARTALSSGRADHAEPLYRQMLAVVPQVADLWHEHGIALLQLGRLPEAQQSLERAVTLGPSNAAYLSNLGVALRALGQSPQAAECFHRALTLGPATPQLYSNLALALKDSGAHDEALATFDRALTLDPTSVDARFNRANLLLSLDRPEEAAHDYQRVIERSPQDHGAYCQLGVALLDLARPAEAIECFERALALRPDYFEARRNRGFAWLAQGDYQRGWPEAEYRLLCADFTPRVAYGNRWCGQPLAGKTLLVHAEQGLGDTLQFVRYVPLLENLGGRILLEVQPALVRLLHASGFGRWLIADGQRPSFDMQCPLMSLPAYLPNIGSGPPWPGPYVSAEPARVAEWRSRLAELTGLRIGIVWSGNPEHRRNASRSAPLAAYAPLAAVPGVRLISLQKGSASEQMRQLNGAFKVHELPPSFDETEGAFMDTAAIMSQLDLVVSVDTSIVHLAGAMGVACWVPLQFAPDWRWLYLGETTPWYPSLRLFRQPKRGDWASVFAAMALALQNRANL
jgi:tetratricopeptide (TPR) repeat protein